MQSTNKLTICSAGYGSKAFLELNWHLTTRLNGVKNLIWLMVDNDLESSKERINENDHRFYVIKNKRHDETIEKQLPSLHHADALINALPYIKTRFALFLDPDFYIVRYQWIQDVVDYMQVNKLSFFGAPWNPKWFVKWRYFPCGYCLFVDLDKVDIRDLDFKPGNRHGSGINLKSRSAIDSDQDTGYRIFRRYINNSFHKHECTVPVFKPGEAFRRGSDYIGQIKGVEFFGSHMNKLIEKVLPDRFCYIPKRKKYYSETGFRELGYFDACSQGWEEFLWQEKPFGFHLRMTPKILGGIDKRSQIPSLEKAIESFG